MALHTAHNANESHFNHASRLSRRHGLTQADPGDGAADEGPPMLERHCRDLYPDVYRGLPAFLAGRVRFRHAAADLPQESHARMSAAQHASQLTAERRAAVRRHAPPHAPRRTRWPYSPKCEPACRRPKGCPRLGQLRAEVAWQP
jgi:hypothetical protein